MKTESVKKVGSTIGKFGSAAAGLGLGTFVMSKVPSFGPPIVQKLLPGLVGMSLAYVIGKKSKSEYAQSAALGLGLAGFANVLRNTVALPSFVSENLSLKGLGYVQNYGQYPAEYFKQPVNGLGYSPEGLIGMGETPVNRLLN